MGTLSLALFNSASYFDPEPVPPPFEPGPGMDGNSRAAKTVRTFGVIYALISVLVLLWGLYNYQRRVTLIKSRWAGSFGAYLPSDLRRPHRPPSGVRCDFYCYSRQLYRDG